MINISPIYIISTIVAFAALYVGLTEKKLLFISDTRSAVIVLVIAGFLMCTSGAIGTFIERAPAHPVTIAGYILGLLALLAGVVQIFNLEVPVLSNPKSALIVIASAIIIKVIIARLKFLLLS